MLRERDDIQSRALLSARTREELERDRAELGTQLEREQFNVERQQQELMQDMDRQVH